MPIVKLDSNFISNNLKTPDNVSRIEMCCSELKGFYVEVRATSQGQGTFYLRSKNIAGKTCHQHIGRTTDISLTDARKQAKILKAEIALGADPRGQEKARKEILLFSDFFENHYLPYVIPRKRSWKRDEELYRLRIKGVLGSKRLNTITRLAIQNFHSALKAEGLAAATCNHHVKLIKHSLNLAIDWDMLEINPAARIPLFFEDNKKENYLDDEQLQSLLAVLYSDPDHMASRIALFLLSTGCRLNEALSAKWSDVDMVKRIFIVRAINSKSKRLRSVPLNDSALAVLSQLDTEETFDYLFINLKTEKPITSINRTWTRLRNRAGLPHLRIHDLRHMYASFLVNSGRQIYEIKQILGHADIKTTERYAHLSTKTLQNAADSASLMIRRGIKPSV
ncbi:site-specific integrase [Sulfurirhabdus autotrophica]|uniref:Site-specific recombinase XerD n=1 Tax=Sulfurirhabdus autotrophica TaxID=1706046 RepID=A0A4V2W247_9PROT|nr:site-specific integrase [Sulfurirhabdus autotrophica]TCV86659.1 site-specific recombinase XerD [Sulfurirhabdus autotrophica]